MGPEGSGHHRHDTSQELTGINLPTAGKVAGECFCGSLVVHPRGPESPNPLPIRRSQKHHRSQDLTLFHAFKGQLHLVKGDFLADEGVEIQPSLAVEIDEHWEVAAG